MLTFRVYINICKGNNLKNPISYNIHGVCIFIDSELKNIIAYLDKEWAEYKSPTLLKLADIKVCFNNATALESKLYADFNVEVSHTGLSFKGKTGNITVTIGSPILISVLDTCDHEKLFWLLERCLYSCLIRNGYGVIHAGAISNGNKTQLIVGAQGAGKSRFLYKKLDEGWSYINDDISIIDRYGYVYNYARRLSVNSRNKNQFDKVRSKNLKRWVLSYIYAIANAVGFTRRLSFKAQLLDISKSNKVDKALVNDLVVLGLNSPVKGYDLTNFITNNFISEYRGPFAREIDLLKCISEAYDHQIEGYEEQMKKQLYSVVSDFLFSAGIHDPRRY